MGFWTRFSRGELRLNPIEALSDGVFAIVVTLAGAGASLRTPNVEGHKGR
jgi:hypothetical protein